MLVIFLLILLYIALYYLLWILLWLYFVRIDCNAPWSVNSVFMTNRLLHYVWFSSKLPTHNRACSKQWQCKNVKFRFKSFNLNGQNDMCVESVLWELFLADKWTSFFRSVYCSFMKSLQQIKIVWCYLSDDIHVIGKYTNSYIF